MTTKDGGEHVDDGLFAYVAIGHGGIIILQLGSRENQSDYLWWYAGFPFDKLFQSRHSVRGFHVERVGAAIDTSHQNKHPSSPFLQTLVIYRAVS